jgi:hypothetical protein
MKKILRVLVMAVFGAFLLCGPALAVTIDFGPGLLTPSGTITVDGTYASGALIPIGVMNVINNEFGPDGQLVFTIPPSVGFTGDYLGPVYLNFDTHPGNNFIQVVDTHDGQYDTNLLYGTFTSWSVLINDQIVFSGEGPDTKYSGILYSWGIPLDIPWSFFTFDIAAKSNGLPSSYDVSNTSVPEPATLLLLGSGLIGLAGFARRRFKK